MAYDELLAERMRAALKSKSKVEEKRMMGGVCFMVAGHMVGGAQREKSGERRFMFRVGKPNMQQALLNPEARQVKMGPRTMGGFIHVNADDCNDEDLERWLSKCIEFTRTLAPKKKEK